MGNKIAFDLKAMVIDYEAGFTQLELAVKYGVAMVTISRRLHELGVARTPRESSDIADLRGRKTYPRKHNRTY